MEKEIIVYEPSPEKKLQVKVDGETVWLSQEQMCQLFGRDRSVITKHIRNIFKEGELDENMSCAKFAHDTRHGALPDRTKRSYTTSSSASSSNRLRGKRNRFAEWAVCKQEMTIPLDKTGTSKFWSVQVSEKAPAKE